jgi:hypothetical protein
LGYIRGLGVDFTFFAAEIISVLYFFSSIFHIGVDSTCFWCCAGFNFSSYFFIFLFSTPTSHIYLSICLFPITISHFLITISCGKYVSSTYIFAVLCLESIINLCTARHLSLRMKLYVGAAVAAITQGL